jgi:hypothetical protein
MTPNMEEDIELAMRAPYISMSESSELPLLIAEDLMWGAPPDLKQSIKSEVNLNNTITLAPLALDESSKTRQTNFSQALQQPQKSTLESSLATLLCSQMLQNQSRCDNQQQQQILLDPSQEIKIKILDHDGNFTIINSNASSTSSTIASPSSDQTMTNDGLLMKINRFLRNLTSISSFLPTPKIFHLISRFDERSRMDNE